MIPKHKPLLIASYGLAVITSGLLSVLGKEAGTAGLKFGLVMGALALAGAALLWLKRPLSGAAVAWLAVAFVGGWFIYDAFIKRGFAQGDARKYLMVVLSAAAAALLCARSAAAPRPQEEQSA